MKLPEYVTKEEVRRVCKNLKLSDWTKIKTPKISLKEAKIVLKQIDSAGLKIDPEQFRMDLEVEFEHGARFKEANVTNNHPVITGKIVLAHIFETLDYYMRLDISEIEAGLFKAVTAKDIEKGEEALPESDQCPHCSGKSRGTSCKISPSSATQPLPTLVSRVAHRLATQTRRAPPLASIRIWRFALRYHFRRNVCAQLVDELKKATTFQDCAAWSIT